MRLTEQQIFSAFRKFNISQSQLDLALSFLACALFAPRSFLLIKFHQLFYFGCLGPSFGCEYTHRICA